MSDVMPPDQTLAHKGAKLAVIILSILIILALIALVAGAIFKLGGKGTLRDGGGAQVFTLPPGAKIAGTETQPGRLILHVHGPAGDEIDIIDTASGHLVSQVRTSP